MRLVCASVKKCSQITDIQGDLKTNSCKGSSTSMTSVDKRLCVGSLSEAGDPSGPRAGGLGGEAFQQHGETTGTSKTQQATPSKINDRGYIYSCSHRRVCC